MRRFFSFFTVLFLLASCERTPSNVSFATDPRILRGTWTGTLEKVCQGRFYNSQFNPMATRALVQQGNAFSSTITHTLFDTTNGTKLGSYNLENLVSPIIWKADGSRLVFLRKSNNTLLRVEANPVTGADELSTPQANLDLSTFASYEYNSDLTRVIKNTGDSSGLTLRILDVATGEVLRTLSGVSYGTYQLSADGTKIAYMKFLNQKYEVWVTDVSTGDHQKLLQLEDFNVSRFSFQANTSLNLFGNTNTATIKQINLKTLELTNLLLETATQANWGLFSTDGKRIVYQLSDQDGFKVKNLDTGALVFEKPFASKQLIGTSRYPNRGEVIAISADGKQVIATPEKNWQCVARVLSADQQQDLVVEVPESQNISLEFKPTFLDSQSYSVSGTAKIGQSEAKSIRGNVQIPNSCSRFAYSIYGCEKLMTALPPPPPWSLDFQDVHFVELNYSDGSAFPTKNDHIGINKNTQTPHIFTRTFSFDLSSEKISYYLDVRPTP